MKKQIYIKDNYNEVWKTIDEFPRYKISNQGRVMSLIGTPKILKPNVIGRYHAVVLSNTPTSKGNY